jgi:hypothetical protein
MAVVLEGKGSFLYIFEFNRKYYRCKKSKNITEYSTDMDKSRFPSIQMEINDVLKVWKDVEGADEYVSPGGEIFVEVQRIK